MPTAPLPVLVDDLAACCTPSTSEALDAASAERLAAVLKVIADPIRLRLLSLVAVHQDPGALDTLGRLVSTVAQPA